MKRVIGLGCLLFCCAGSMGCGGDSAEKMLRDALITHNELSDVMLQVTDEDTAKDLLKTKVDSLKKKWDTLAVRNKILQDMEPEQKVAAVDFELRYLDELTECALRLKSETDRLKELRLQAMLEEYARLRQEEFVPTTIDGESYALLSRGTVSKDLRDELLDRARPSTPVKAQAGIQAGPQAGGPTLTGTKAGQAHTISGSQLCPSLTALIEMPKVFDIVQVWSENPLMVRPGEFKQIPGFPGSQVKQGMGMNP